MLCIHKLLFLDTHKDLSNILLRYTYRVTRIYFSFFIFASVIHVAITTVYVNFTIVKYKCEIISSYVITAVRFKHCLHFA